MARNCPGLELLRKDMLTYELQIREEKSEGTVPELVTRLRAALGKPVKITEDNTGEVAANLDLLDSWVNDVSKSFSYLEQPTTRQVERLKAHLAHFASRVRDIKDLTVEPEVLRRVEGLSTSVEQLFGRLTSLGAEDLAGRGSASSLSNLNLQDGPRSSLPQREEHSSLISPNFANLPNPIMCMFKGIERLSITTKDGFKQLLWLLVDLEQQIGTFQLKSSIVWALLYPLTDSCLRTLIAQALKEEMSLRVFRERVVKFELPFRWYLELEQEYLWRIQGGEETLRDYMDRVRMAALALNPGMNEEQVVSNVVEGMLPQHRTSLLVLGRPLNWEGLLKGVKEIERFALLDEQRARPAANARMVSQDAGSLGVGGSRPKFDTRRCFRCHSADHLVRQCPVPRADR